MGFLRNKKEKRRLVAELIDDLVSGPDPMEEYNRWENIDFIITQGFVISILVVLFTVRDITVLAFSILGIIIALFAYLHIKTVKKNEEALGKMFLDSTTYFSESDRVEQIEVEGWELLILPEMMLTKDELVYSKDDLLETLSALSSPDVRTGGGPIYAPVIEEIARVRADKYIDEYKREQTIKEAGHRGFFKRKKPTTDMSAVEDSRDEVLDLIKDIKFLGEEDDDGEEG
jgi:hypothetical protein